MPESSDGGPHPIEFVDSVDSTNAEAFRRARAGSRGPLWIVAGRQTAGRGRSGRIWQSPIGNLHASLLIEIDCPPLTAAQLAFVAGVAAHEALVALAPQLAPDLILKWPNDVLLGGAKLGGILVETSASPAGALTAVIGVGVNVAMSPDDIERPTMSLAVAGAGVTAVAAAQALSAHVSRWLAVWDRGRGFAAVRAAWLARAHPLGAPLSVHVGARPVPGLFGGLAEDGALLLNTEQGTIERITFGDVMLLDRR